MLLSVIGLNLNIFKIKTLLVGFFSEETTTLQEILLSNQRVILNVHSSSSTV